ncbi:MAG: DNA repair protein RecO [Gammaproteobacteria bacterium]|nr:DNA repair protein RecO [Gammaproteobacteria bacterium]
MAPSKSQISLQPAYVLHSKPYRDTSLLIEAFTPEFGRIGLVARGARAAKSRMRGLLQLFRPLLISWVGKGDLVTLAAAEEHGLAPVLGGRALLSGFYLNELLLRLLHRHDPHPALFHMYDAALHGLAAQADGNPPDGDAQLQQTLRTFEKNLLQEVGYGLVLDHDVVTGSSIEADGKYRYHLEKGPIQLAAPEVEKGVGISIQGRSLIALAQNDLGDASVLREAKRLLREALAVHLGPKPLRSRELYGELKGGLT